MLSSSQSLLSVSVFDIRYAIGASLVSVIATSSGAAAAYVREGYTNIRIGMFLEIATSLGAILGALLAARVNPMWIGLVFGVVLLHAAYTSLRRHPQELGIEIPSSALTRTLRFDGSYPTPEGTRTYHVRSVPTS